MTSFYSAEKTRNFYNSALKGDLPLVQSLFLDPEVDVNWKDYTGRTAFFYACINDHVDVVRFLLDVSQRRIDYTSPDPNGLTALAYACDYGRGRVVEVLVEDGRIDVNKVNPSEGPSLWRAAHQGHLGVVKPILATRRQIDITRRDYFHQKTAAEVARERGKDDVAALLEEYERDPQKVKARLRKELGFSDERLAGELFALVRYFHEGCFALRSDQADPQPNEKAQNFFSLAVQLPADLQMVLCNRVYGINGPEVKSLDAERGFRKFASEGVSSSSPAPASPAATLSSPSSPPSTRKSALRSFFSLFH